MVDDFTMSVWSAIAIFGIGFLLFGRMAINRNSGGWFLGAAFCGVCIIFLSSWLAHREFDDRVRLCEAVYPLTTRMCRIYLRMDADERDLFDKFVWENGR